MALMRPDQTFYPSPRMAMQAPAERVGYVALLNYGTSERPDALGVVDLYIATNKSAHRVS
jgi:selenium-binding protein 1